MELFKYIVRFFYRIRWYMVLLPLIVGILAYILTSNMDKSFDVKTTIYTGIITGYNVDVSDSRNANVHLSNLINIITTERTLKVVSLRLLTRCLIYGDAEKNTSYITAEHYQELEAIIPREVKALIDRQDEERTLNTLIAYERPNANNFVYGLLNYTHPYFSIPVLSQKIKVVQLDNSDLIEIGYSANDPGIAYNTLEILNEEFVKQYACMKPEGVYDTLNPYRRELVSPLILSDKEYVNQWLKVEYQGKHFDEEAGIIITEKGERVRSKSEKIIADKLYAMGIPYRYECPITLSNGIR